MECLLLVVFPEKDIADSGQNSSIVRQFGKNDLIPFEGLFCPTNYLVYVGYLENGFGNGDNRLYFLQSLSK